MDEDHADQDSWKAVANAGSADTQFVIKFRLTEDGYLLSLSDFLHWYEERLDQAQVSLRNSRLNPDFEVSVLDLLGELGSLMKRQVIEADVSISSNGRCVELRIAGNLFHCAFQWSFSAVRLPQSAFFSGMTQPSLKMVSALMQQVQHLEQLIKDKEAEIKDYEEGGAQLSRPSLKTEPFLSCNRLQPEPNLFRLLTATRFTSLLRQLRLIDMAKDNDGGVPDSCKTLTQLQPVQEHVRPADPKKKRMTSSSNPMLTSKQSRPKSGGCDASRQQDPGLSRRLKKL